MNEVIKTILERRSVKKYKPEQIKDEELQQILEAGKYAACGRNMQAGKMAVVQNPEIIAQMAKINAEIMHANINPFYGAPTVIVVFADKNVPTYVEDGSLIIGNMLLAAHSLGIDSCWIHRAKETFETEQGRKWRKEWNIGDEYVGVGHCILGYRDTEYPKAKARKDDFVVCVK
jgi:nitroreductase